MNSTVAVLGIIVARGKLVRQEFAWIALMVLAVIVMDNVYTMLAVAIYVKI
jgi:hypothetical protein